MVKVKPLPGKNHQLVLLALFHGKLDGLGPSRSPKYAITNSEITEALLGKLGVEDVRKLVDAKEEARNDLVKMHVAKNFKPGEAEPTAGHLYAPDYAGFLRGYVFPLPLKPLEERAFTEYYSHPSTRRLFFEPGYWVKGVESGFENQFGYALNYVILRMFSCAEMWLKFNFI